MALRLKGSYGLALLFTTGIVGWMATGETVFSGQQNENATPPPAVRNHQAEDEAVRVAVKTFTAQQRENILIIRGRTEADTKVSVRAETTAIVRERFAKKGEFVQQGDLLCRLDIGSREASLAKSEAALAQAEFDLNAKQTLATKGYASETQLAALKAQRDAALANVKDAKLELERTEIRAPIAGIVQGTLAEVGDQLATGGVCAEIMKPDPMLVVGQVSERDIQKVKVGTKAEIKLVSDEAAEGTVRYVSATSDVETRTFLVEVEIDNANQTIRDGITAVAKLELQPLEAHFMSPAHLTLSDEGLVGVMIVENNTTKFTPVSILSNDTDGIWVAGLPVKADVITVGQEYVKDGQTVVAVPEGSQVEGANKSAQLGSGGQS
ncbi:efflux RND transporter periplasmic adaptor subunit [uncultured Cohaesibacter sp.]|uniref:efflux RND transporter periplasmic adaptor subunit n=1 Tax=uncultured Cohaesibacter sp. TaxID=1002546 RepID=UPI0029C95DEC|nr:efflux RND transporter periplasmic adaptor subunit [uncultured Cohaesibacter sp.]